MFFGTFFHKIYTLFRPKSIFFANHGYNMDHFFDYFGRFSTVYLTRKTIIIEKTGEYTLYYRPQKLKKCLILYVWFEKKSTTTCFLFPLNWAQNSKSHMHPFFRVDKKKTKRMVPLFQIYTAYSSIMSLGDGWYL